MAFSSISGLPVSLQQHSTPQVDTLTGVQKLATHSNVPEKNSNIVHGNGSHQTVMSQQRVSLTPQKSMLSASNVAGSANLASVRVDTSNNFQSVSDRSLELGEYVSTKRQLEIDNTENNDAKRRKTEKGSLILNLNLNNNRYRPPCLLVSSCIYILRLVLMAEEGE